MSADTRPRIASGRLTAGLAAGVWLALIGLASAQGFDSAGHPSLNGFGVFAAWNPSAGGSHSGGYAIEDHPNRQGWDYRINLPWVRLNSTYFRARSGAAMVGVVEDTTNAATTLQNAVHVDNSIWLFAVDVGGVVRIQDAPEPAQRHLRRRRECHHAVGRLAAGRPGRADVQGGEAGRGRPGRGNRHRYHLRGGPRG
ncbi:MAG: hypothetical protein ACREJR_07725 [Candidatus Rokuibacteriota bacterium]